MSVFEIIMLVAFGSAWPFSIYRSFKSQNNRGKSIIFLVIILCGYISGIIHKYFYSFDRVIFLYVVNSLLVFTDIIIYIRNVSLEKKD